MTVPNLLDARAQRRAQLPIFTLLATLLSAGACSSSETPTPPATDAGDATLDALEDVANDVGADVTLDAAGDAVETGDAITDAVGDAITDASGDAVGDAAADAIGDGVADASADASDGAVDPFALPARCSSETTYTTGFNASMAPGRACLGCHDGSGASAFALAGTAYPTGHEPDNCNGSPSTASVLVTDATGRTVTLAIDGAGNFFLPAATAGTLVVPWQVQLRSALATRPMVSPVVSGDCNACHTQNGVGGAPGRVVTP